MDYDSLVRLFSNENINQWDFCLYGDGRQLFVEVDSLGLLVEVGYDVGVPLTAQDIPDLESAYEGLQEVTDPEAVSACGALLWVCRKLGSRPQGCVLPTPAPKHMALIRRLRARKGG